MARKSAAPKLLNTPCGRCLTFRQNPLDGDASESHAQIEPMRGRRSGVGEALAYQILATGSAVEVRRNVAEFGLRVNRIRTRPKPEHDVAATTSRLDVSGYVLHDHGARAVMDH